MDYSLRFGEAILCCSVEIDCVVFSRRWKVPFLSMRHWSLACSEMVLSSASLSKILVEDSSMVFQLVGSYSWQVVVISFLVSVSESILRVLSFNH